MQTANYTQVRNNLKQYMDETSKNHEPLVIHRQNGENMVLLSQLDYDALEETAYLLRSPENAKRILESIESFRNDSGTERKLIEEEG